MDSMYSFCVLLYLCPETSTVFCVASGCTVFLLLLSYCYGFYIFLFLYFKTLKLQEKENGFAAAGKSSFFLIYINVHLSTAVGPFYDCMMATQHTSAHNAPGQLLNIHSIDCGYINTCNTHSTKVSVLSQYL